MLLVGTKSRPFREPAYQTQAKHKTTKYVISRVTWAADGGVFTILSCTVDRLLVFDHSHVNVKRASGVMPKANMRPCIPSHNTMGYFFQAE